MEKGHTYVQWMVAFVAEMTLLTYGLQAGWVSPMTKALQSPSSPAGRPLTDMELTWVASVLSLAAAGGVPLFVFLADRYGRKIGVLVLAVMQAMSWIVRLCSSSATSLIVANAVAGVPAGGCFQLVPLYVKEISQDNLRGTLVAMFLLMQNCGVLTMFTLGAYLDYYTVLWIVLAISLVTIAALVKAPESPAFLVKMGKHEEAAATVAFLRGHSLDNKEVVKEVDCMKQDDRHFKSQPDVTILSILRKKSSRTGLIIIVMAMTTQGMNGTFAIITYASTVMSASGITLSPELQPLSIPIVMIFGSVMSMSCVENIGRKTILATTYAVTAAALACLGASLLLQQRGTAVPGWLPLAAIVTTACCYAAGIVSMPYVIMSEMFNFQIRAKVAGCVVSYAWFIAFLQLLVYTPAAALLGMHGAMFCFAAVNLLGLLVTLVAVPETRGRSVHEIETMLEKKWTQSRQQ